MDSYFYTVIIAGIIAGAATGLLGAYIIGMRVPFIGTCISHASMAGYIYGGLLIGFISPSLASTGAVAGGIILSITAALSLAAIRPDKSRLDSNAALSIIFCFMLGATFLGIGLNQGSRTEMLGLLWGNILFVSRAKTIIIALLTLVLIIFLGLFSKEMKALLFSRPIAAATGVHESFVYSLFLILCGIILAVNLPLVGGLMIFSLITCPASAAFQLCRGYKAVLISSTVFGMLSSLLGFLFSFYLNLPTGACIVLVSVVIFAVVWVFRAALGHSD